ncbi:MAG: 5'/3'-nucleotidase SurE [Rhodospirillaceae bacterium]|nr:5'/3'-nucleotidase SurE [Rhodospirillaceae bacterium]
MPDRSHAGGFRVLLSNDDGIHAPGFKVLEEIAAGLSDDVWVSAPETEQSGASHSLTLHRPLRIREIEPRRFMVDGTPTDCVLLAVNRVMKDHAPDLVLSGVNLGQNLAEDVTYSGTIAAAMEATLMGVPSIALSQVLRVGHPPDWSTARVWGPKVIRACLDAGWPQNVLININFPPVGADEVTGIAVVPHGRAKIGDQLTARTDPRGREYIWIGTQRSELHRFDPTAPTGDTDLDAIAKNKVTVTPLHMDLSHYPTIQALESVIA